MGQSHSIDLHMRLIAEIDKGMSCWAAAALFEFVPSTRIRWDARRRAVAHFESKAQGGGMRPHLWLQTKADPSCDVVLVYSGCSQSGLWLM